MGEKETGAVAGSPSEVMFNPREYSRTAPSSEAALVAAGSAETSAEKSVQWEPHKAPGLDTPEQERLLPVEEAPGEGGEAELKTRHDTVKNSINNVR